MNTRIDTLLEKYWAGESSLQEEQELKQMLKDAEGYASEKEFFQGISEYGLAEASNLKNPLRYQRKWLTTWLKVAASVSILLALGLSLFTYEQKKAEKEAYLQLMEALALIQENFQKGTNSMEAIQEFRHLQVPLNLFEFESK